MTAFVCAVDVGTRSARAGLFAPDGTMVAREVASFPVYDAADRGAEYASEEIWSAVKDAVRRVRVNADLPPDAVQGLAFDATCSLVLRGADGGGLALGPGGRDTIAWFDHRAVAEAAECTASGHQMISFTGGSMPPEMQTPKLLWLKRHRPDLWATLARARDLTDDLTARATGDAACSSGTLSAKWAYLAQLGGWQTAFLDAIGLEDLIRRAALPAVPVPVGHPIGGLSPAAAADLGLGPGIPVAAGLIDAYAGALGAAGTQAWSGPRARVALVTGTSTCVLAISRQPIQAKGVWGPYLGTVLPDQFSCEGGQSAAGASLDHILDMWPLPNGTARPTHDMVSDRIEHLLAGAGASLGADIHVLPDFLGNRTPFGDPTLRGTIAGLTLDRSFDGLCTLYWRTALALVLGTRQIIEHMQASGLGIDEVSILGGLARNPLLCQLHADAIGLTIRKPRAKDSVLLGTAMAASVAAGWNRDLAAACAAMSPEEDVIAPRPETNASYDRAFAAFHLLQQHREALNAL